MAIVEDGQMEGRRESFLASGPVEVVAALVRGRLEVDAVGSEEVTVEISVDDPAGPGATAGRLELAARAIRETEVRFSPSDGELVLRTPRNHSLRNVGLRISAAVPSGSALTAKAGRASVRVNGTLARLNVATGSGDIETGDVHGDVEIKAGSGDTRLGRIGGHARARSGSGSFEARAIAQAAKIMTGNGSITVGDVGADLAVRTGNGGVTVEDVTAGRLDLATGSGDIQVGIHDGVAAEIDLVSGSGSARSELDVTSGPVPGVTAVRVRARTGSGDAVVLRAARGEP